MTFSIGSVFGFSFSLWSAKTMNQTETGRKKKKKRNEILIIMTISISFNKMEEVLILLLLVFLNAYNIEAAPTYLYNTCSGGNYTSSNSYEMNLYTSLSSLTTNTTSKGFVKATLGQAMPDIVYAQYLCRGDVNPAVCGDCVKTASKEIIQRCPGKKASIIWYDECLLRYSNSYIFGSAATEGGVTMYNTMNVTDPDEFGQLVEKTMGEVIQDAANSDAGKKFAVGKANFTSLRTLYTLAQCTPDIAAEDCNRCLVQISGQLPLDKQGARFLAPSCNVRFELYPFYNESAVLITVPPPPSPPPPSHALSPFPATSKGRKISRVVIVAIVAAIATGAVLVLIGCCFFRRKAATEQTVIKLSESATEYTSSARSSLHFDLSTIQSATNNFSHDNKVGEGGFGAVYKGILSNGQNVAVKRLSHSSGQGAIEFENEVKVVAKLQHRNLVRLFGFCLAGKEKLLVYEFVPNKSLDYFLFDPQKQSLLDWSNRYKILTGIAKGMLYLHEDSRLRIIHRDLKASNVLLDNEMNPKVSDFGMAKIFGLNQTEGSTNRVVGTYGYMAPEYAMHGQFSVKTDVYGFGILLLEIISGKRSNYLCQSDYIEILSSFAWKHWRNGTPLEVIDPLLGDSFDRTEVVKCIHVGLLCIQENPADRPTMAAVVHMLNSQTVSMAVPRKPAFFFDNRTEAVGMISSKSPSSSRSTPLSMNEVSITELYPR